MCLSNPLIEPPTRKCLVPTFSSSLARKGQRINFGVRLVLTPHSLPPYIAVHIHFSRKFPHLIISAHCSTSCSPSDIGHSLRYTRSVERLGLDGTRFPVQVTKIKSVRFRWDQKESGTIRSNRVQIEKTLLIPWSKIIMILDPIRLCFLILFWSFDPNYYRRHWYSIIGGLDIEIINSLKGFPFFLWVWTWPFHIHSGERNDATLLIHTTIHVDPTNKSSFLDPPCLCHPMDPLTCFHYLRPCLLDVGEAGCPRHSHIGPVLNINIPITPWNVCSWLTGFHRLFQATWHQIQHFEITA